MATNTQWDQIRWWYPSALPLMFRFGLNEMYARILIDLGVISFKLKWLSLSKGYSLNLKRFWGYFRMRDRRIGCRRLWGYNWGRMFWMLLIVLQQIRLANKIKRRLIRLWKRSERVLRNSRQQRGQGVRKIARNKNRRIGIVMKNEKSRAGTVGQVTIGENKKK